MARKDKESGLDRLLKIAQVMNLMNGPGQSARGQNLQAALAMLGIMGQGEDRKLRREEGEADRGFRREEGQASREFTMREGDKSRTHTSAEAEKTREQAMQQFLQQMGFNRERAGAEDFRYGDTANFRDKQANIDNKFKDKSFKLSEELGRGQLAETGRGNTMDLMRMLLSDPNTDKNAVLENSGDPMAERLGQALKAAGLKSMIDKQLPQLQGMTDPAARSNMLSQLPREVQEQILPRLNMLPGQIDYSQDFLPASMTGTKSASVMPEEAQPSPSATIPKATISWGPTGPQVQNGPNLWDWLMEGSTDASKQLYYRSKR